MEILAIVAGNDFRLRIPIVKHVIQVSGEVVDEPFDAETAERMGVFLERADGCTRKLPWRVDEEHEGNIIADVKAPLGIGTYSLIIAGIRQNRQFRSKERRQIKIVDNNERANITPTFYDGWDAYSLDTMYILDARGRDGLSAYELAVLHGFVGTETEWLKSLAIRRIYKSSTSGLVDTYTIVYSNMATSTFTVTNGESAYQIAVRLGLFSGTEEEFIQWLRVPTILTDLCVKTKHIDDEAVTEDKLDEDLLNQIRSAGAHGYALAKEFGDSTLIGVCQKALTKAFDKVYGILEELSGNVYRGISMVVTPSYFISEEGCDVHITATTVEANGVFEHIAFFVDGELIAEAEDVESFETDAELTETAEVKCVAKIMGIEYERVKVVTHYNSFWLGAGASHQDIMDVNHLIPIKNGMRGAYDVNVLDGQHIIIVLGESLREGFLRADINGVEIPFVESTVTVNGNRYKVFVSENTYQAGTYNIDVNG